MADTTAALAPAAGDPTAGVGPVPVRVPVRVPVNRGLRLRDNPHLSNTTSIKTAMDTDTTITGMATTKATGAGSSNSTT